MSQNNETPRVHPTVQVALTPRGSQPLRTRTVIRTEVYYPLQESQPLRTHVTIHTEVYPPPRQDTPPLDPDRVVEVIFID